MIFIAALGLVFLGACALAAGDYYEDAELEHAFESVPTPNPIPSPGSTPTPSPSPSPTPEPSPTPISSPNPSPGPAPAPVFIAEPLSREIIELITDSSFHHNTPFGHDHLAYLTISHMDFEGNSQIGNMIVAAEIAQEVLDIFKEIYAARFPIHQMRLIDYFEASDELSMAANNTVGFNFRYIAGTNIISRHGLGMAIDINPIQNPYLRGDNLKPEAGAPYLDRQYIRPGMIYPGCPVYTAFISRGWIWGGNWTSPRDYHHFERHD